MYILLEKHSFWKKFRVIFGLKRAVFTVMLLETCNCQKMFKSDENPIQINLKQKLNNVRFNKIPCQL